MTIDAKKIATATYILSLQDEEAIDAIFKSISAVRSESIKQYYSSLPEIESRSFDLDRIKVEQNYRKPIPGELTEIAKRADIQESTEELLNDLKALD